MSSTILSAVDTLGEAQNKLEISRAIYSGLMYQHFDNKLEATRNNEVAFFMQRDTIRLEMTAVMDFVMQAYEDVTSVLNSLDTEQEKA